MCESVEDSSLDELGDALSKVSLKEVVDHEDPDLCEEARELLQSMNSLECPFTWKPTQAPPMDNPEAIISKVEEKGEEIEEDEDVGLPWRAFIFNLVLCYEYARNGLISQAFVKQRECEANLKRADSVKEGEESALCIAINGLRHVTLSCKCYLEFKSKIFGEAKATLKSIQPLVNMSEKDQASVWGTRGALYMEYGYNGTKAAVGYIEQALELDPEQGEWHFLLGKTLGRIRRIDSYNEIPEKRELKSLERAIQITKNASYMIFLAQAYRETAFRIYSCHKDDMKKFKTICETMNDRAVKLYRDALELRSECSHVNIRCAQGFLKMPSPYRDVTLAKSCINKALSLAPNNAMAHHIAGTYFERQERVMEKAKSHYFQAGENGAFGAYMDLYRIKLNENSDYNPMPDFEKLLLRYKEEPRQQETLCQMGSYWYFVKNNFKEALNYWQKVIDQNPGSDKLKTHKCIFIGMKAPVDINEIIFDEARLSLKERSGTSEDRKLMRRMIVSYSKSHPQFSEQSPKSRRKMILDEIEENESRRSRFRNNRGRGRGRGAGQWRGRGRGGQSRGQHGQRGRGSQMGHRSQSRDGAFQGNYRGGRGRGSRNSSRQGSRDSSVESYSRQNYGSRDSSVDSRGGGRRSYDRSAQDTNWRREPREVPRRYSEGADISQGRPRTDSVSSVGSGPDGMRDWRQGCSGGGKSHTESCSSNGEGINPPWPSMNTDNNARRGGYDRQTSYDGGRRGYRRDSSHDSGRGGYGRDSSRDSGGGGYGSDSSRNERKGYDRQLSDEGRKGGRGREGENYGGWRGGSTRGTGGNREAWRGGSGRDTSGNREGGRGGSGRGTSGNREGWRGGSDRDTSSNREGWRGGSGRDTSGNREGWRGGSGRDTSSNREGWRGGSGRDTSSNREGWRGGFGRDTSGNREGGRGSSGRGTSGNREGWRGGSGRDTSGNLERGRGGSGRGTSGNREGWRGGSSRAEQSYSNLLKNYKSYERGSNEELGGFDTGSFHKKGNYNDVKKDSMY